MLKEILSILRKEDLLKQAVAQAEEMFTKSELMFKNARDVLAACWHVPLFMKGQKAFLIPGYRFYKIRLENSLMI